MDEPKKQLGGVGVVFCVRLQKEEVMEPYPGTKTKSQRGYVSKRCRFLFFFFFLNPSVVLSLCRIPVNVRSSPPLGLGWRAAGSLGSHPSMLIRRKDKTLRRDGLSSEFISGM